MTESSLLLREGAEVSWTSLYQALNDRAKPEIWCPFPSTVPQDRVPRLVVQEGAAEELGAEE